MHQDADAFRAGATSPAIPATVTRESVLTTLRLSHPRLLLLAEDEARIRRVFTTDIVARSFRDALLRNGSRLLTQPTPERVLIGPRLLTVSRPVLERVLTLGCSTAWTGTRVADPGPRGAAGGGRLRGLEPAHFLDVAEMSHAFAVGYDWLYDGLSEDDRASAGALVEKGLLPAEDAYAARAWWAGDRSTGTWSVTAASPSAPWPWPARSRTSPAPCCPGPAGAPGRARLLRPGRRLGRRAGLLELRHEVHRLRPGGAAQRPGQRLRPEHACRALRGRPFPRCRAPARPGCSSTSPTPARARATSRRSSGWPDASTTPCSPGAPARPRPADPPPATCCGTTRGAPRKTSPPPLDAHYPAAHRRLPLRLDRQARDLRRLQGRRQRRQPLHLDLGTFVLDALGQRWAGDLGPDDYDLPGYFGPERFTY